MNKRLITETSVKENTEFVQFECNYRVRYVVTYRDDIQGESRTQRVTGSRRCYQNTKARGDIFEGKVYKMDGAKSPKYAYGV